MLKKKVELEQMRDLVMSCSAIVLEFHGKDFGRCIKDIYITADKDGKLKHEICTDQAYKNFDDHRSFDIQPWR